MPTLAQAAGPEPGSLSRARQDPPPKLRTMFSATQRHGRDGQRPSSYEIEPQRSDGGQSTANSPVRYASLSRRQSAAVKTQLTVVRDEARRGPRGTTVSVVRVGTWDVEYARGAEKNNRRLAQLLARHSAVWVLTETHDDLDLSAMHDAMHSEDRYATPGGRWTTIWMSLPVLERLETTDPTRCVAVRLDGGSASRDRRVSDGRSRVRIDCHHGFPPSHWLRHDPIKGDEVVLGPIRGGPAARLRSGSLCVCAVVDPVQGRPRVASTPRPVTLSRIPEMARSREPSRRSGQWQLVVPWSVKDCPATGTNCQS